MADATGTQASRLLECEARKDSLRFESPPFDVAIDVAGGTPAFQSHPPCSAMSAACCLLPTAFCLPPYSSKLKLDRHATLDQAGARRKNAAGSINDKGPIKDVLGSHE